MGVGEAMTGVQSKSAIDVIAGGSRLAQITAVGLGFVDRESMLRLISFLFFGCLGEKRERKSA